MRAMREEGEAMKRLILAVLVIFSFAALTACAGVIDSEGAKIGDPKAFAEATHIAAMSQESLQATSTAVSLQTTRTAADISAQATRTAADIQAQATAEAIAHDRQQAETDKVRAQATVALAKAKTEVEAQPAEASGKSILYLLSWGGLGAGALVLCVGAAFAVSAWLNKRATVIYPNKQGQFPLVPERGPGWTVYHDPNRALGPGTVITKPGYAEWLVQSANHLLGKAEAREPSADYPQTATEQTMLALGVGAQAVQNEVAKQSGRPKLLFGFLPIGAQPAQGQTRTRGRMPQISVINDPKEIEHFEQKLLGDGGDE
jgi:hypothetical protein